MGEIGLIHRSIFVPRAIIKDRLFSTKYIISNLSTQCRHSGVACHKHRQSYINILLQEKLDKLLVRFVAAILIEKFGVRQVDRALNMAFSGTFSSCKTFGRSYAPKEITGPRIYNLNIGRSVVKIVGNLMHLINIADNSVLIKYFIVVVTNLANRKSGSWLISAFKSRTLFSDPFLETSIHYLNIFSAEESEHPGCSRTIINPKRLIADYMVIAADSESTHMFYEIFN